MKELIESAWEDRSLLEKDATKNAILKTINLLDKGEIRIAEKNNGTWSVNQWIKKAVILYFPIIKAHGTLKVPALKFFGSEPGITTDFSGM